LDTMIWSKKPSHATVPFNGSRLQPKNKKTISEIKPKSLDNRKYIWLL
jgi:hypothetical protein